jgi:hypothetical protein
MTATKLLADNGVTSGITGYQLTGGDDGTMQLQTTTAGGTATTAVTVDNSQNVGIGGTPSAWGGGFKVLQLSATSLGADSGGFNLTQNAYYDGTNWRYIATGAATSYSQGAGTHTFYHAASGSAGTVVSWASDVVIDTSGDLILTKSGNLNLNILSSASSSSPVYQKFPSGLIVQSGSSVFSGSSNAITYPVAFSSTAWPLVANGDTNVNGPGTTMGVTGVSLTGFTIVSTAGGLQRVNWIVFGY